MKQPIHLYMPKTKKRILDAAVLLLSLFVLVAFFQNCSNKGALDLNSVGPLVATVNVPAFIDAANADAVAQLGYGTLAQDSERGSVFQITGNASIVSNTRIKIHMDRRYRLSGKFKSAGSIPSVIYFGLATYRANGAHIESWEGSRTGISAIIESVSGNTIHTRNDVVGWNTGAVSSYSKAIGFYFNGDTNRLPDYVLTNWGIGAATPGSGTYSSASGRAIELNIPVPAGILAQIRPTTRVLNHYAGGSYVYTAAQGNSVTTTWQDFTGTITGFDMANSIDKFRAETDHVAIIILANYQQNSSAVLNVDDLKFEEVP